MAYVKSECIIDFKDFILHSEKRPSNWDILSGNTPFKADTVVCSTHIHNYAKRIMSHPELYLIIRPSKRKIYKLKNFPVPRMSFDYI